MVDSNGVPTAGVDLVQMQVLHPLNQQIKELCVSLLLSHLLFSLPSLLPLSPLSLLNIQVHKFAKKGGMKQGKESKPVKKVCPHPKFCTRCVVWLCGDDSAVSHNLYGLANMAFKKKLVC